MYWYLIIALLFTTSPFYMLPFLPTARAAEEPNQSSASANSLWVETNLPLRTQNSTLSHLRAYRLLTLDETALKARLDAAPQEAAAVGSQAVVPQKAASAETAAEKAVVAVPLPDGSFARISLEESAILSPELAARYPKIKTYRGQGIEDRSMTARLDYTPAGFHGMLISEKGTVYIDPLRGPDTGQYVSYWKRDLTPKEPFRCLVEAASAAETPREGFFNARRSPTNPSGTQLRTYRLAMTATGEYT